MDINATICRLHEISDFSNNAYEFAKIVSNGSRRKAAMAPMIGLYLEIIQEALDAARHAISVPAGLAGLVDSRVGVFSDTNKAAYEEVVRSRKVAAIDAATKAASAP